MRSTPKLFMRFKLHSMLVGLLFLFLQLFLLPVKMLAETVTYKGMCNASAAVALGADYFVVADDEDNTLRIYNRERSAGPFQTVPLAKLFPGEIQDGEDLEIDLEGAANLEDTVFWIGSHSASKKGKFRPARHRLFALRFKINTDGQFVIMPVGKIYTTLVTELEKDRRFDRYKLHQAQSIKPKEIDGLSIEGLASTSDGHLLIGFRNPLSRVKIKKGKLVEGKALVIPLLNPLDTVKGKAAQFGDPIDLDLDGYGVRSLERLNKNQFLIVAGPYHDNLDDEKQGREPSRLYLWSDKLQLLDTIHLGDLNIEAAFIYPTQEHLSVQLLSDDGKLNCHNGFRSRTEILEEYLTDVTQP